jgi:hypothetical protein
VFSSVLFAKLPLKTANLSSREAGTPCELNHKSFKSFVIVDVSSTSTCQNLNQKFSCFFLDIDEPAHKQDTAVGFHSARVVSLTKMAATSADQVKNFERQLKEAVEITLDPLAAPQQRSNAYEVSTGFYSCSQDNFKLCNFNLPCRRCLMTTRGKYIDS